MKFVERNEINIEKWDALVQSKTSSFFSYSWYLDSVAENWCILVNADYTSGIALPYTKRLGVEILYIPIFSRFMEVLGELSQSEVLQIQKRFKVVEFATRTNIFDSKMTRVHQVVVDFESRHISTQAKRSLKKAISTGIELTGNQTSDSIMAAIEMELQDKFKGVDAQRIASLKELFDSAKEKGYLQIFEVSDGKESGGVACLANDTEVLYVKGACPENLKKNGGMYLALNAAIEYAQEKNLTFDFGGSNVEGVQRFNKNLGGTDQPYYYSEWNNAPFWFQWARKLKNR